jgi:hypothetical protein
MTKPLFKYIVRNEKQSPMVVILEPWAEEFDVPPNGVLEIGILDSMDESIETTQKNQCLVVWLWGGCRATVSLDGRDCTPPTLNVVFPDWLRTAPQTPNE